MNYRAFATRLVQEHPQTIAVVLARIQPADASEILKLLPVHIQADLVKRIVHLDQLPEEVLEEIESLIATLTR